MLVFSLRGSIFIIKQAICVNPGQPWNPEFNLIRIFTGYIKDLLNYPLPARRCLMSDYEEIQSSLISMSDVLSCLCSDSIGVYAKTKAHISCAMTYQLISAFVFATRIIQFLFYLYPKFEASSLLL